jgi:hypothetical protein
MSGGKLKVKVANCSFTILGMDLECAACGELVRSGHHHECSLVNGKRESRTWPIDAGSKGGGS